VAHLVSGERAVDSVAWRGRRVLLTGHTGFKGAWLALWLQSLGAEVLGLSRGMPTAPSLYELARVSEGMTDETSLDIRDADQVLAVARRWAPDAVLHLAAQPLVRRSFVDPRDTFEINVMGTVNVLEAVRATPSVSAAVIVTSDKCYENRGWEWGYREDEPMGGHDPYSASKGAVEIVVSSYRRSFFADRGTAVATARAGNVVGGGDWASDRLIPDIIRAVASQRPLRVRNPNSVRPWQHVLNPLSGYLLLAQSLVEQPELAGGWNFGPPDDDAHPVSWIVDRMGRRWQGRLHWEIDPGPHPAEAAYLRLDSSRARLHLGWRPPVPFATALDSIVDWHEAHARGADMREVTLGQLDALTG
jgi:CDP-glucose 4,6-dehydratase